MSTIHATSASASGRARRPPASAGRPQDPSVDGRDGWIARRTQGWRWWVHPDWVFLLDSAEGPSWLRLADDPRAQLVKANDTRQVWRVQAGGHTIFAKVSCAGGFWDRCRQVILGPDSRREKAVADYAARHAIPTVRPVAAGYAPRPGRGPASILLTVGLGDAEPLHSFWTRLDPADPGTRRIKNALIDVVARLIARAHQNGFVHADLHAGNVLVQCPDGAGCSAVFVDLLNVRLARPVGDGTVTRNLAQFNQWFRLHAPLTDRLRFLDRYLHWHEALEREGACGRRLGLDRRGLLAAVDRAAMLHARWLYAKRDHRAMGRGRYFARIHPAPGWRGHVFLQCKHPVPGSPASSRIFTAAQWTGWLSDPLAWVRADDQRRLIKDSASARVCRATLPADGGGGLEVVCKRSRPRNLLKRIKYALRPSRALLTWQRANALLNRQIPTARPLAVLERRCLGVRLDSLLVTEYIPHAHDLDTLLTVQLRDMSAPRQRELKNAIIASLAGVVRRFHAGGFVHRDFKAPNIMVQWDPRGDAAPRVLLVDLDGVRQRRRPGRRALLRALMRLNVSLDHCRRVTRTDRLRFLQRVLARPGVPEPAWKETWRAIARLSARKRRRKERGYRRMMARYGRS